MAAVRRDHQVGLRPCTVQSPGALHGTDHIVAALHDHGGDVANGTDVAQQLIVGFKKTAVDKVVGLDAREGQGELVLFIVAGEGGIGQELGRCALRWSDGCSRQ